MAASGSGLTPIEKRGDNFDQFGGYFFPKRIYDFDKLDRGALGEVEFREGDVFVVSFAKSGQNWLILSLRELYKGDWGVCRLGDHIMEPMIDWPAFRDGEAIGGRIGEFRTQFLENPTALPSPRLFRGHIPCDFFPLQEVKKKGGKIIYIARNPKDVCTSYYHYMKAWLHGEWEVPWQQLADHDFLKGHVSHGPWLKHVLGWSNRAAADDDTILCVTFENLKTDFKGELGKIADFIGRPVTQSDLERAEEKCAFQRMDQQHLHFDEKNTDYNRGRFFRKGAIGDWKTHFTVAQSERFDEEIDGKLKDAGIFMKYE